MRRIEQKRYAWIREIKVGDVLQAKSGTFRVVRYVKHVTSHKKLHTYVYFAIRHCSWTGRCYTTIGHNDLIAAGYRPTGVNIKLDTKFDKEVAAEMGQMVAMPPKIKCCDVRGIA